MCSPPIGIVKLSEVFMKICLLFANQIIVGRRTKRQKLLGPKRELRQLAKGRTLSTSTPSELSETDATNSKGYLRYDGRRRFEIYHSTKVISKTRTITTQRERILLVELLHAEYAHAHSINRIHSFCSVIVIVFVIAAV